MRGGAFCKGSIPLAAAAPSGLRGVAHGLDVVAVGADDEGGVVVRVVLRPQAGGAVVASPTTVPAATCRAGAASVSTAGVPAICGATYAGRRADSFPQSSEASRETTWTAQTEMIFRSTMLELGVLGTLSLIMVVAIYMLRRSRRYAGDVAV